MKNGDDLHQIVAHCMDHQNRQSRHGAFPNPCFRIEARGMREHGYGGDGRIDARSNMRGGSGIAFGDVGQKPIEIGERVLGIDVKAKT